MKSEKLKKAYVKTKIENRSEPYCPFSQYNFSVINIYRYRNNRCYVIISNRTHVVYLINIEKSLQLTHFTMTIVKEYELDVNGYEIVSASDDVNSIPNFVVIKDGRVCFIIVHVAVAPNMPALNERLKINILRHAEKFNATCYYAPVGFGSSDGERFMASLALRGDGFYSNFRGLEELK